MTPSFVYLDNAATSWPKDPSVGRAMIDFLDHKAGNPGRGGHVLARAAADTVEETRQTIAQTHQRPLFKSCCAYTWVY